MMFTARKKLLVYSALVVDALYRSSRRLNAAMIGGRANFIFDFTIEYARSLSTVEKKSLAR